MKERAKRLGAIPNFPWVQPKIRKLRPVIRNKRAAPTPEAVHPNNTAFLIGMNQGNDAPLLVTLPPPTAKRAKKARAPTTTAANGISTGENADTANNHSTLERRAKNGSTGVET